MNVVRRVVKNTIFIAISQVLVKSINFVFIVFLARLIGVQDFGKYSFIIVLFGMLSLLANFGFDTLLVRDIARNKTLSSSYFWNSLFIKLLISLAILIVLSALFGFTNIINDSVKRNCLTISCFILIFSCATQTMWSFADAYEKMQYHSILNICYSFAKMAVGLALVFIGYGLTALFLGLLLAEVLIFILTAMVINKALNLPSWSINFTMVRNLIQDSWPFALLGFLGLIYFRIDIIILFWLKGDQIVGWYSAAYGLLVGLMLIPDSLLTALFPVMARYYENSEENLKLAYQKSVKYLFILGLPLSAAMIILSDKIILLLFGQAYLAAIPAVRILGLALLLIFINAPLGRMFFSLNKQRIILLLSLITVSANIVLNILMIPKLSYIGASIATVLSEILSSLIFFPLLAKLSFKVNIFEVALKPLTACSLMVIFMLFFRQIDLFLLIFLSVCIYSIGLFAVKTFDYNDKYLFKRVFQSAK